MKLKKIISLLATFAIALTMITLPVKADGELSWWHMDEASLVDSEKPNKSKVVNALGGKESGTVYYFETNTNSSNALAESYIRLNASAYGATGSFDDASKCLVYPKTNGYNSDASQTMQSYEGYMIISLNLYPTSNSRRFTLTRRGGGGVSGTITTAESNHFVINQWNKVDIFVRLSASAANRKSTTYVNGQFVYTHNSHSLFSLSNGQDEDLRFGVPKEDGRAGYYIDDMYVAFTTQTPAIDNVATAFSSVLAMPTLSGISGRAVVSDNALALFDAVTVAELGNANTNTVTAFADSTFTTELSQDTVLDSGNIVVVTDRKGKMSYYTVSDMRIKDISWMLDVSKVTRYEKASGLAGKAADDISMQYPEASGDRYMQLEYTGWYSDDSYALKTPAADMTAYNGYMTISYNVMAPNETNSVGITTNQGTVVAGSNAGGAISMTSANGFVKGRWNRVVHIISLTSGVSSADTYVNGVLRGTWNSVLYSSGKTAIRLSARDSGLIYFDDVKIEFTQAEPDADAIIGIPVISGIANKAEISGKHIRLLDDITLTELKAVNTNVDIKVFTNSTFAATISEQTALADGNIAVVTDSKGAISYFGITAANVPDLLWTLDNSDIVKSDVITVETNVGGGKAASDDVLHYGSGDIYRRLNYLETAQNIAQSGALTTPISDMTQYNGYMVISLNVMSPVETKDFSVTTSGGNIIVGNNAGGSIGITSGNGFAPNRWNHIVSVIRLDNGSTSALQTTYVNGIKLSERAHVLYSEGKTEVRLNAKGEGDIYFDDVTIKFTQVEPDIDDVAAMPQVPTSGYNVTLSQAIAGGATGVYSSSNLIPANRVTNSSDIVKLGYYLVKEVEDADGNKKYVYNTACNGMNFALFDRTYTNNRIVNFNARTKDGKFEWVSGIGGKDSTDESAKMTFIPSGNNPSNGESTYLYYNFDKTIASENEYLIIECNIYVDEESAKNFSTFGFASNGGAQIAGWYGTGSTLKAGAWNNFVAAIKFNGEEAPTYTTYINGQFAEEGSSNKRLVTDETPQIRLVFNAYNTEKEANILQKREEYLYNFGSFSAYVDDLKIYGSNTMPTPKQSLLMESFTNEYAVADRGDSVYTDLFTVMYGRMLVQEWYPSAEIHVWRDGEELTDDDLQLQDGDVVWYKPYADEEIYGRYVIKHGLAIIGKEIGKSMSARYYGSANTSKVIMAVYGQNLELTDLLSADNQVLNQTVSQEEAKMVKFMAVDGFKDFEPLCKARYFINYNN